MSAIRSASSMAVTSMADRSHVRWVVWSVRRPGVATSRSTPRCSSAACRLKDMPPTTQPVDRPSAEANGASASMTCWANSRVGTSTRPRGLLGAGPAALEARQHGEAEGEGLAGAGLSAAEQVAAAPACRAGWRPGWGTAREARTRQRADEGTRQAEVCERGHARGGCGPEQLRDGGIGWEPSGATGRGRRGMATAGPAGAGARRGWCAAGRRREGQTNLRDVARRTERQRRDVATGISETSRGADIAPWWGTADAPISTGVAGALATTLAEA